MPEHSFQYIFGPVYSWRLGYSLGVDPISSDKKVCNFNCLYCQLGATDDITNERAVYVPTSVIIREIKNLPQLKIDYITFTGLGEPTLAKNLGEMIRAVRALRPEQIAVITNASLVHLEEVRRDLAHADMVLMKLDAVSQEMLEQINRPASFLRFEQIIDGMKEFRTIFKKKLALQIMFLEDNANHVDGFVKVAKEIQADEIELNTPLRPCGARALDQAALASIKESFKGLPVVMVYEKERKAFTPLDAVQTQKRHGKYKADL